MRRTLIVVVLALLGLVVGFAVTELGPRSYTATDEYWLPAHSHGATRLEAVARSQHVQGVRVRVHDGHTFEVTGHGSLEGSYRALNAVNSQIWKTVKHLQLAHVRMIYGGVHALARPQGNAMHTGAMGLLAGLGIGLGIVVPHRRRVTAVAG